MPPRMRKHAVQGTVVCLSEETEWGGVVCIIKRWKFDYGTILHHIQLMWAPCQCDVR